jgi:glycosyltransferase involved in cell wall biosynthesis
MPKISVIIPVYNAEKYLEECLNSVISQNERDCEVILINDGSRDSSLAICQKFAEQDNRIIIIDKKNGGVSSARNAGLEKARGKFIAFADSDDYVSKEIYSSVFEKFGERFDMALTGIVYKGKEEKKDGFSFLDDEYENDSIRADLMPRFYFYGKGFQKYPVSGHVWQMIFRRKLIDETKFSEEVRYSEDLLFCLMNLRKAGRVVVDKNCNYYYRRGIGSVTEKYIENMENDIEIVGQRLEPLFSDALGKYGKCVNLKHFHIMAFARNLSSSKPILFCARKLKECMRRDFFSCVINQVNPELLGSWHRFLLFLMKHGCYFLLVLSYKIRLRLCTFI